jgi:hypothetical protein
MDSCRLVDRVAGVPQHESGLSSEHTWGSSGMSAVEPFSLAVDPARLTGPSTGSATPVSGDLPGPRTCGAAVSPAAAPSPSWPQATIATKENR